MTTDNNSCATFVVPSNLKEKNPDARFLGTKEIPQVEKMIPLTDCLDSKGNTLPQHLVSRITNKTMGAVYVRFPSGVENFLIPYTHESKLQYVPSGTVIVRDESKQDGSLLGIPAIKGGSF
jgi:hypothetical protein